jgi:hypothetical protein
MDDDVEPIDLEPIDLEPSADEARFERERAPRPARSFWIVAVVLGLAAWAVVALVSSTSHRDEAVAPTSTLPVPSVAPQPDRVGVPAPTLRAALQAAGVSRFAAVIDDHLYILDENRARETLVRLPQGRVTIDDQNGQLLLASTFEQTLVSTQPIATRTLSARDFAIPAWAPTRWWILNSDGTIRADGGGPRLHIPDGLRVAAAVAGGFVALDVANASWVLWAGPTTQKIAPAADQLLVTGPHTVVFKKGCGYNGCSVEILDLAHGTTTTIPLPQVPNFAALSPDGTRLALASTQGGVFVLDTRSGREIVRTVSVVSGIPSLPFTWSPDSHALLIVQDDDIEIRRASDGLATSVIRRTGGLQQLIALP